MNKLVLTLSAFIVAAVSVLAHKEIKTMTFPKAIVTDTVQNSPEAKAMKHAAYMQQKLKLTDNQKQQIYTLTLNKVKSAAALKTTYNGDTKAAQADLTKLRTKYDTNVTSVLTADQYAKWKQILEDQKIKAQQPAKLNEYDPTILDSQW